LPRALYRHLCEVPDVQSGTIREIHIARLFISGKGVADAFLVNLKCRVVNTKKLRYVPSARTEIEQKWKSIRLNIHPLVHPLVAK